MSTLDGRDVVVETLERLQSELNDGAQWENTSLSSFLDAFSALLGSIENAYVNNGQAVPDDPWVLVASALDGARYYE